MYAHKKTAYCAYASSLSAYEKIAWKLYPHTIYSIQTQLQDVLRIERPATLVL